MYEYQLSYATMILIQITIGSSQSIFINSLRTYKLK